MTSYHSITLSRELFDTSHSDRTRLSVCLSTDGSTVAALAARQERRTTRVGHLSLSLAEDKLKTVTCLVKVLAKYSCGTERRGEERRGARPSAF